MQLKISLIIENIDLALQSLSETQIFAESKGDGYRGDY